MTQHEFNKQVLQILEEMRRGRTDERMQCKIEALDSQLPVEPENEGQWE